MTLLRLFGRMYKAVSKETDFMGRNIFLIACGMFGLAIAGEDHTVSAVSANAIPLDSGGRHGTVAAVPVGLDSRYRSGDWSNASRLLSTAPTGLTLFIR